MIGPDLHPDELLDRAAAGTLTPEEQARLDAHLAACPACRFEQTARADFAGLPLPSMPVDELVTRALAGMPTASLAHASRPRRFSPAAVAAVVVLVGAGSFAAVGLARPIAVLLGIAAPTPVTLEAPRPAPAVERRAPPPAVEEQPSPQPPPPPMAEAPESTPSPPPPRVSSVKPAPAPSIAEPTPTAAGLFEQATLARTRGRHGDAEQRYRELTSRFPDSPEAGVAHAVMGRLLLDLERPAEAVRELEAALSTDAALREDALANLAVAFERTHDAVRARSAWRQLLDEFPASIHAKRARERLEVLNTP
ncbi:MAG: zf-HC2 domain-containing protein [Myxococcaceae bacterium]|nr:zf-HC2 domain-containing protein [Myxococcaceae bacterium]